jgi:hypothetical protein
MTQNPQCLIEQIPIVMHRHRHDTSVGVSVHPVMFCSKYMVSMI